MGWGQIGKNCDVFWLTVFRWRNGDDVTVMMS